MRRAFTLLEWIAILFFGLIVLSFCVPMCSERSSGGKEIRKLQEQVKGGDRIEDLAPRLALSLLPGRLKLMADRGNRAKVQFMGLGGWSGHEGKELVGPVQALPPWEAFEAGWTRYGGGFHLYAVRMDARSHLLEQESQTFPDVQALSTYLLASSPRYRHLRRLEAYRKTDMIGRYFMGIHFNTHGKVEELPVVHFLD